MIIDCHMHAGEFGDPFGVSLDPGQLAEVFAANKIDAGMVFCADNALTLRVLELVPQAWGFYWANPSRPGFVDQAADWLCGPRAKGVKLHPLLHSFHPSSRALDPLMELLAERGLPVLIHTGHPPVSEPLQVGDLVRRHPDVNVILGHAGHGNAYYVSDAISLAEQHPSVWLETSGMPMFTKIKEMERRCPGRTLFGSDVPFHTWRGERDRVHDGTHLSRDRGGNGRQRPPPPLPRAGSCPGGRHRRLARGLAAFQQSAPGQDDS